MMHLIGVVMFVMVLEWFVKVIVKEVVVENRKDCSDCKNKCHPNRSGWSHRIW
jgi:hypothetical protein